MKTTVSKLFILLIIGLFSLPPVSAQEKHMDISSWPELNKFHEIIAKTFHPAEQGNYAPAKENAGELNERALALQKSTPPAEFNNDKIKAAVKELTIKTQDFSNMTKRDISNKAVMDGISAVHDAFHKIIGLCTHDESEQKKK